jgi:hypothetical protein
MRAPRPRSTDSHNLGWWPVVLLASVLAGSADAATPLADLTVSSDVTVSFTAGVFGDEDAIVDDLMGGATAVTPTGIPAAADLAAYHRLANGDVLLAFDVTVALPGSITARAGDVVRFDGVDYTIELAAIDHFPSGARVDALTEASNGDLLLSLDVTVTLDGVTAADEDLLRFDGAVFTLFFDASSTGIDPALDLDGAMLLPASGGLLASFDGGGSVDEVSFGDEDLIEYDFGATSWTLAYDGSTAQVDWPNADLDAVFAREAGPPCEQGECNGDDVLTTADVTCTILRLFDQIPQASPCEDCNSDMVLTTADVTCTILCLFDQCP